MKKCLLISFCLLVASTCSFVAHASEATIPGIVPKKKAKPALKAMFKPADFRGKLTPNLFISSVEGAQNSWRSLLHKKDGGIRVGLKVGNWDRPDPEIVDTVWLACKVDWANIKRSHREIEFRYRFDESTDGITSVFKFGTDASGIDKQLGDQSLTLTYGASTVEFRRGDDTTSGELPFDIESGTEVVLRLKDGGFVDIWINEQAILADQSVDLATNFFSIFAITEDTSAPGFLNLSSVKAKLVLPDAPLGL